MKQWHDPQLYSTFCSVLIIKGYQNQNLDGKSDKYYL